MPKTSLFHFHLDSTLALLHSRRTCRRSSTSVPAIGFVRRTSILISLLSIASLLTSVAAAAPPPRNPAPPPSVALTNGSSAIHSTLRRRMLSTTTPSATSSTSTSAISTTNTQPSLETVAVSEKLRNVAYFVLIITICSLMIIITIAGNLVIILSVCLVRKLQTASNILIVSLAVSDVLVGLIIMPLAMVPELADGDWILGSIMCDIWTSTDVLLCTSSILNFLIISIDRYCIINHPFKYAPMRKVKLLSLMIAGVWISSALVSLPPILGWGRPSESLPKCQVSTKLEYQIFATMVSFYIPLIVVLIIYANIYRTAQTAMDNRSSIQMSQFLTHNNSTANVGQTNVMTPLAQQQLNGNSCSTPQLLLNVSNNANSNPNDDGSAASVAEQRPTGRRTLGRLSKNASETKSTGCLSTSRCLGRRLSTPFNGRLSVFVTRRYSFFRHVHLPNQKAIRTLGVILGTFIVCWLPFMSYAIIKPLHEYITGLAGAPRHLNAPKWLDPVLLWFGYTSSMLNPLIYSKFNREFRMPFREIIYCHCRDLNEKMRRQEFLENLYGDDHHQVSVPPPAHLQPGTHARASTAGIEATV